MIIDNSIKKIMAGSDNIEKVFNRDGVLWQAHYDHTTTLIFKGNSGTLDIDKLPPEYTWSVQGQTMRSYQDGQILFALMWCPYDDQHQFYTGDPNYNNSNVPGHLSDYVSQAPRTYSTDTGNLFGSLQTSIIDNGKKLQFTYTNTGFYSPYQSMPVKYVKISFNNPYI